ncbi:hypothetical protein GCM10007063_34730 [Lentibacillus kapialis]|uniref:Uncharacterized protein n=1 Tax=Lentibacillus kapialis TaxID=340214 RepID=A0A917V1G9_9BACI|nr:hypothetical protein GCM10007063_34730 [Lentibacillus kapialis]
MFIFLCLNVLVWSVSSNIILWFNLDTGFITFLIIRFVINGFILPLMVFVVTLNYFDWQEESGTDTPGYMVRGDDFGN